MPGGRKEAPNPFGCGRLGNEKVPQNACNVTRGTDRYIKSKEDAITGLSATVIADVRYPSHPIVKDFHSLPYYA